MCNHGNNDEKLCQSVSQFIVLLYSNYRKTSIFEPNLTQIVNCSRTARSVDRIFSLCIGCLWFKIFPVSILGAEFVFWLLRFLVIAYLLLSLGNKTHNLQTIIGYWNNA